jgi:hypothetical protein
MEPRLRADETAERDRPIPIEEGIRGYKALYIPPKRTERPEAPARIVWLAAAGLEDHKFFQEDCVTPIRAEVLAKGDLRPRVRE